MIVTSIDKALSAIAKALRSRKAEPYEPNDLRSTAVRRVWDAVDKTRIFLASTKRDKARERVPNPELIRLWSEAALAIAVIDGELARRLRMKAEYWSNPETWSEDQIQKARIGIDTVADEVRNLVTVPAPPSRTKRKQESDHRDIFISHASEDKQTVARPLAESLKSQGYRVWYDEFTLKLGDSLRNEIDKGLVLCHYGAVILSPSFFSKEWPQFELDALFALEARDRRKRILPIWHHLTVDEVVSFSPMLAGRLGAPTSRGLQYVVKQIVDVLNDGPSRSRTARRKA